MKTRKYIYLILGTIIIVFDILAIYFTYDDFKTYFSTVGFDMSFLLVPLVLLIIGLALLFSAYRVQRKINRKNKQVLENAFTEQEFKH